MRRVWLALCLWLLALPAAAFDDGRVDFQVEVKGLVNPYKVLGLFVMPQETLSLRVREGEGDFRLKAKAGSGRRLEGNAWSWQAPAKPGLYPITIDRKAGGQAMTLNVFVMVPHERVRNGQLNGYDIGQYPTEPKDGLSIYLPPAGFVELTKANFDTPIAPHLTLGQFQCKQDGDFPKYVVIQEPLLLKLQLLLERLNAEGVNAPRFHVMSAYRTPHYNRLLGNVKYSFHQFGGAADVYIDADDDGHMDDLNGDGNLDDADATFLYDLFDRFSEEDAFQPFLGGLGRYRANRHHGPFVHVDVRGSLARWGRPKDEPPAEEAAPEPSS